MMTYWFTLLVISHVPECPLKRRLTFLNSDILFRKIQNSVFAKSLPPDLLCCVQLDGKKGEGLPRLPSGQQDGFRSNVALELSCTDHVWLPKHKELMYYMLFNLKPSCSEPEPHVANGYHNGLLRISSSSGPEQTALVLQEVSHGTLTSLWQASSPPLLWTQLKHCSRAAHCSSTGAFSPWGLAERLRQ